MEKENNPILIFIGVGLLIVIILATTGALGKKNPEKSGSVVQKSNISDDKYLELSKQCKIDSQKNLEEDIDSATREKYKNDVVNCFYEPPVYFFNKELNTCLYFGGYSCDLKKVYKEDSILKGQPAKRWYKHITDVYTNKSLVDVYIEDSSNVADWERTQIDNFWSKRDELGLK